MERKKLLLLVLPGLFLAFWSCGLQSVLHSSPREVGPNLVGYDRVVLDPPPVKMGGEILIPARYLSPAGRGYAASPAGQYLPLDAALDAWGLAFSGVDPREVKLPVPDGGWSGRFRYRFHPVYNIQARLDPAGELLQGKLLLAYQNPYFYPLTELQFNLPANGMAEAANSMTVHRVKINQIEAAFMVQGTRLEVPLNRPLFSRQTLVVEIDFSTHIPDRAARLGVFDGVTMVSGWYPLLAPRQEGAWQGMAEGASFGEPYFADAAYYQVDLRVPSHLVVVASGRVTGRTEGGGWTGWSFSSEHPIREFAFAAGAGWQFAGRRVGPVELVLATRSRPSPEILDTAVQALKYFQEYWGTYPYSYLHLVEVPLEGLSGMEYPGLIFLSTLKGYSPPVVVHEVAHQWWYNLVGNDSIRAAWIDEGLAEYSTLLYYSFADPDYYRRRKEEIASVAGRELELADLPLTAYASEEDYRRIVYRQGVLYWLRWEESMGRQALGDALRYVQEYYLFERVGVEALQRILEFYRDPQKHLAY
ncbi:MAG: M1 family metallopeptidase [Thermoanaerobacteraceae bacterium]|nr:M1 family metallopeptidase [Thermoanaerobacteraceae bacterium]